MYHFVAFVGSPSPLFKAPANATLVDGKGLRFDGSHWTPKAAQDWLTEQSVPGKLEESIEDYAPVKIDGASVYVGGARVEFRNDSSSDGREVLRFDAPAELNAPEAFGEGFVKLQGLTTRAGVFRYRKADGGEIRELRPPEEVFARDSLASFNGIPITIDHVPRVDFQNARSHMHGVSVNPSQHGDHVRADNLVYTKEAIDAIKAGKRQLSYGYSATVFDSPGIWTTPDGKKEPFDTVQRNIRGNHLAIVDRARAGDKATLRLDGEDAIGQDSPQALPKTQPEPGAKLATKKITHDGKDHEVDEGIANLIESAKKQISDSANSLLTLTKERDAAQGRADAAEAKAKKDAEDALKVDAQKADAKAIAERIDLAEKALPFLGKTIGEIAKLDASEIVRQTVAKANPDLKLDGKSDDYIRAFFDAATAPTGNALKRAIGGAPFAPVKGEDKKDAADPEAARKRMIENAGKREETKAS